MEYRSVPKNIPDPFPNHHNPLTLPIKESYTLFSEKKLAFTLITIGLTTSIAINLAAVTAFLSLGNLAGNIK